MTKVIIYNGKFDWIKTEYVAYYILTGYVIAEA